MAKQTALNALIDTYYKTLGELAQQYATHEGAVSVAFQSLLAATARRHHWTLIPQLSAKGIRPDATLKDPMGLVRGHWEAKDTDDNLDVEIAKKIQKGYPLGNIIFEDTRAAILIQNKTEVMRVDLRDRQQLARLLDAFFAYVEPQIETFEKAVDEFKERVPDIAIHLKEKIVDAHATNKKGNFIVNLIRRIPKRALRRVYTKQLFANEIMLLPYYIAALNIEHVYYEQTGEYEAFDGLCFVDTLDLAEPRQNGFSFMTEKNTE